MNNSIKTQNISSSDWVEGRADKWRRNLLGLEATLAPIDEPLIRGLQLEGAGKIADVGCGGGGTSLELARRAAEGSVVHGFDISPVLIDVARGRIPPGARGIAFELADVSQVVPSHAPYDRLVSRFGVMFFEDPLRAFTNLARWLAPGGRFAFAVWGAIPDNAWIGIVRESVGAVVELPPFDPEAPGPFRYADSGKLLAVLERAGFTELEVRDWRGVLSVGGGLPPGEAAAFALGSFSAFAEILAEAGGEAARAAHELVEARFSRHLRDGVVELEACVHIISGRSNIAGA